MAEFPSSLKTFTTKKDDVDFVVAEHVNTLQDELAAVQSFVGTNADGAVVKGTKTQEFSNKTHDGDFNLKNTTDNINVAGTGPLRTIVLKPGFLKPTTTAGSADPAQSETSGSNINYDTLDYDQTTEEHAFAMFTLPDGWNGGVITFRVKWTAASGTGGVVWGLAGRSFANDDPIDAAVGTEVEVTDTLITAEDMHVSPVSGNVTLAGGPAGGEEVYIEIARKVDNGSDTLNADAQLISVVVEFRRAQHSD